MNNITHDQRHKAHLAAVPRLQSVLIGFLINLTSHLERSTLNHSYGYASAVDRPTCFVTLARKSDPFMQYAGR